jgi:urea transport system permease protein
MEVWAMQIFNGLSLSSILLLIALGLALYFGLMNVINLAHGEFIMIGAYTPYACNSLLSTSPVIPRRG